MSDILILCHAGYTSSIIAQKIAISAQKRGLKLNVFWATVLNWNATGYKESTVVTNQQKDHQMPGLNIPMSKWSSQKSLTPKDYEESQFDNIKLVLLTPQARMYQDQIREKIPSCIPILPIIPKQLEDYDAMLDYALNALKETAS